MGRKAKDVPLDRFERLALRRLSHGEVRMDVLVSAGVDRVVGEGMLIRGDESQDWGSIRGIEEEHLVTEPPGRAEGDLKGMEPSQDLRQNCLVVIGQKLDRLERVRDGDVRGYTHIGCRVVLTAVS